MLARGTGTIINISSIFGLVAVPQRLALPASPRRALNMMTKAMAIEWAARVRRVNAIAPGYVRDRVHQASSRAVCSTPARSLRRTPMGRLGSSGRDRGGGALPGYPRLLLHHRRDPHGGWGMVPPDGFL